MVCALADFAQIRFGKVVCVSVCGKCVVDCLSINKVNYLLSVFYFFRGSLRSGSIDAAFCLLSRSLGTNWEYNIIIVIIMMILT